MTSQSQDAFEVARAVITAYFDSNGINNAKVAGFNIVTLLHEAGLTVAKFDRATPSPTRDGAEGAGEDDLQADVLVAMKATEETDLDYLTGLVSKPATNRDMMRSFRSQIIAVAASEAYERLAAPPKHAPDAPAPDAMREALRVAKAAMIRTRTASIAGCEEGYGKPQLWADELFASHGDLTKAIALCADAEVAHAQRFPATERAKK